MRRNLFRLAFLSLILSSAAPQLRPASAPRAAPRAEENRIFDLVNRERAKARLGSLRWSDRLADLARNYSRRMAREGFFDHIDREGLSVVERAGRARISGWTKIGENLFLCEQTDRSSELAVRGWMRSWTHRQNILDPDWQATGIGLAVARNGDIYITEIFAAK